MKYIKLYEHFSFFKKPVNTDTEEIQMAKKYVLYGIDVIEKGEEHNLYHYIQRNTENLSSEYIERICELIKKADKLKPTDIEYTNIVKEVKNILYNTNESLLVQPGTTDKNGKLKKDLTDLKSGDLLNADSDFKIKPFIRIGDNIRMVNKTINKGDLIEIIDVNWTTLRCSIKINDISNIYYKVSLAGILNCCS